MSPDGGDYATSKYLKWHRAGSISVVAVLFVAYSIRFGVAGSMRPFAIFILPLVLIWFSDDLASWGGGQPPRWGSNPIGDVETRIGAWLMLLILAALRIQMLVML